MKRVPALALCTALTMLPVPGSAADRLAVVAAENFYGDVAQQIGGPRVKVTSILSNPDQDPHLFEVSPSVARAVSAAQIVIHNGIGYDAWMEKLLRSARSPRRRVIAVADLLGRKAGDNPHIWYDPATMPTLANKLADILGSIDSTHRVDYEQRLATFQQSLEPIRTRISELRARLTGTPATATEPVFGYMFEAFGMNVRNQSFQLSVMNDTEPRASDIAAFENDLKTHQVRMMVYNIQASGPVAARLENLARAAGVPVVGATETEPPGKTYQAWMMSELDAVDRALAQER